MSTASDRPAETSGWHVNRDRRQITRHPEPDHWVNTWEVEALSEQEKLHNTATHEAAHAVLWALAGVPILDVTVRTMTEAAKGFALGVTVKGPFHAAIYPVLLGACAGERAEDRWLHETGLWNEERAWVVERLARSDRREAATCIREASSRVLTCQSNGEWNDLPTIHDHTDKALDDHWASVTALAEALVQKRHLDERQIADIAGITNPAV